jgi:hypothetical protein
LLEFEEYPQVFTDALAPLILPPVVPATVGISKLETLIGSPCTMQLINLIFLSFLETKILGVPESLN